MLYQFICKHCSKHFEHRKSDKKFCSNDCYRKSKDIQVSKICEFCSKHFVVPYRGRKQRFCSNQCAGSARSQHADLNRAKIPCLECSKEFEIIPSSVSKYCSTDCFYKHKYGRESVTVWLVCKNCNVDFEVPFIKRDRQFCSKKCMISGDFNPSKDSETNKKIVETRRRNIESGLKQPAWLDKTHTDESKEKMSQARLKAVEEGIPNGMLGRNHTEESKEKMSKSKTQLILDGKFNPLETYHVSGWYESTKAKKSFYRSSWERDVMIWLDSNDDVISWESESVRIPYMYDDHKRWYVPDFIVVYKDKKIMYEVKPKEFLGALKTVLKESAAREWCSQNGVNDYQYITKQFLLENGILKLHAGNVSSTSSNDS